MIKKIIVVIILSISLAAMAKGKKLQFVGVYYYKNLFGHVHQNPSKYSASLTTIECGHPVRIYKTKGTFIGRWASVTVAGHKGYIIRAFLRKSKVSCFQKKYPKFLNSLSLDLGQLYYWGKLYDHYEIVIPKVGR